MNLFGKPETAEEKEERLARIRASGRKVIIAEVKNGYMLRAAFVDADDDESEIFVAATIPTALDLAKELLEKKD